MSRAVDMSAGTPLPLTTTIQMPPRKKIKSSSASSRPTKLAATNPGSSSTSKASGRRSENAGRHNAGGQMRELEDMPFDVMFEVLSPTISISHKPGFDLRSPDS